MMQRMRRVVLAAAILGSGAALAYSPAIVAQSLPSSRADLAYSYAPLVTVWFRPKGLPIASTMSPTSIESESRSSR